MGVSISSGVPVIPLTFDEKYCILGSVLGPAILTHLWKALGPLWLHSRKLTWKPKKGPIKTTVPLKGGYMGFHVSLGECKFFVLPPPRCWSCLLDGHLCAAAASKDTGNYQGYSRAGHPGLSPKGSR